VGRKVERGEGVGEVEIRNTKREMRNPTLKTHPRITQTRKDEPPASNDLRRDSVMSAERGRN